MTIITKEELLLKKERFFTKIISGAVFVHPTDTIYGLGANALSSEAVESLRRIKDRYEHPFSIIAPSKEWVIQNCILDENAYEWLNKLPGPYTLILKLRNRNAVSSKVNLGTDTIGVRMPDHWIQKVVEELKVPIITTSANKTGDTFMTNMEDLSPEIKQQSDFIVFEGEIHGMPSKIVDLTQNLTVIER